MKKYLLIACLVASLSAKAATVADIQAPKIAATAYAIEDAQSGQILAAKDLHEPIEPASLTKLMTAYLTFKALKEGTLSLEQTFTVSTKGWRTEGSRMFLDPRTPATVSDLLKGLIVQSGNDAAVTLAEAIGGSEENFAHMMNQAAAQLGMKDSHFENSTGLPAPKHRTSVADLLTLSNAIIRDFPEYYPLYSIKSFKYNHIEQPNRNLLLYRDPSVDGLKTGHTQSAGYNLVASSHRNNRRVISVVIGTENPEARASASSELINWALQLFDTPKLFSAGDVLAEAQVYKGKKNVVKIGFANDTYLTAPKGSAENIQPTLSMTEPIIAPVTLHQVLGKVTFMSGDTVLGERDVVALEEVKESGWLGRLWDSIKLWFKNLFSS